MRGFSSKAIKPESDDSTPPPRASEGEPAEAARDIAKRFAPARPYMVVSTNEAISGELGKEQPIAMSWDLAKRSFGQGFRCLWAIPRVLVTRAKLRLKLAYHRIMQARILPWALAGSGWGFSMGLAMIVMVIK